MSKAVSNEPAFYLVITGGAQASHIERPALCAYPVAGLTFRQGAIDGSAVEVFVAAPADLVAFADLAAASILKPVCLPLTIAELKHGRINCELRTDPKAQRLAQTILAAIAAFRHPAPSAGVCAYQPTGDEK